MWGEERVAPNLCFYQNQHNFLRDRNNHTAQFGPESVQLYSASSLEGPQLNKSSYIGHTCTKFCLWTSLLLLCRYIILPAHRDGQRWTEHRFPILANTNAPFCYDVTNDPGSLSRHHTSLLVHARYFQTPKGTPLVETCQQRHRKLA